MNERNAKSYEILYSAYTKKHLPWPVASAPRSRGGVKVLDAASLAAIIQGALDGLEPHTTLRPDAKYFLLVNLHQMVVLPIALSGNQALNSKIREAVREDVKTIVTAARPKKASTTEVSGHAILDAVAKTWKDLKSNQLEFWE